jgi:TRAP-type C4-dicarboxylate transport system substrate-binding protein
MAWGFIGLFHSRFPLTDMVTLPLLGIENAETGSLLMWHLYEKFDAIKDEFKDVKLITLHTHRGGPIGTSKPIHAIKDFRGLKMRTPGGGILQFMKATGASPMGMSPDDIYMNMEKGVIEGWTIDPLGAEARKLQEVTKYYIKPYSYIGAFFIIMNKNKWNSLPPEIQKQIMSVSGKFGARFHGKAWDRAAIEAEEIIVTEMKKRGGEAITLSPQEVEKWRDNARGVWDKEVKRWEEKGKPAKEILVEIERYLKEN